MKKVLLLGSSALKIGEAGEFDYSGSQAIKALKEEGIYTILINPNIATNQTSEHLADQIYFLPVNPKFVEEVIKKEKPDGIMLSFGGQTALNCGLDLHRNGTLKKYNVQILGSPIKAVIDTEDRELFNKALAEIDVKFPKSKAVHSVDEALNASEELGYPVLIRIAYALGGLGSGVCKNRDEVIQLTSKALSYTSQILVEEYLVGWKEIEYEIVRDKYDNCITVCNMENLDPMGIHTGESIVVAPSQTLTNAEFHKLREIAIKVIRHFKIVGECNIQYALDTNSDDYRVIEVNARLSRSSALASKATGYPLAFVAAKLAIGKGLHELRNSITKTTSAFFEPALDYIVVKIPRWDLKKFKRVSRKIGPSMKSVGEVMAIGRKFEEALQKALRMLDIGADGLVANSRNFYPENIELALEEPGDERLFAVAKAMKENISIDRINELTNINKWFLYKIKNIIELEEELTTQTFDSFDTDLLLRAKRYGFGDKQIGNILDVEAKEIASLRREHKIIPAALQIDTMAAEYPAKTNYMYLTYNESSNEIPKCDKKCVIILGSGPYRIGSSVEFDWCCVNAGKTARDMGYKTIMINCNPETVSTDYDEFDMMFFEELTLETINEIYRKLPAEGVIFSMGGQVPNNLAVKLTRSGVKLLGTNSDKIDLAENRSTFSDMLDRLVIDQPEWKQLTTLDESKRFANNIGYPVLVRPSYVLSGAAMGIATNDDELEKFLQRAVDISDDHPTVISKFLLNAKEFEFDGVAKNGNIVRYAISEHVENAGVHSGDATLVLPPQRTYLETMRQIRRISKLIANELQIHGPFNIQFIAKQNQVKVIECNVRASRSFPFVSKTLRTNFIDIATRVMLGENIVSEEPSLFTYDYVAVKAPEFSFTRLEGADPTTGVEMASTGEVACFGDDFNEAFLKAFISVGYKFPIRTIMISSGTIESKAELLESVRLFQKLGINFYATGGTTRFLKANGINAEIVYWPLDTRKPNAAEVLKSGKVDLVINIPKTFQEDELTNDYIIRRTAVDYKIPLITNRQIVMRLAEALNEKNLSELAIKSWGEY